ncbi:MAG: hypothetical protein ACRDT4_06825 [Micromonosporaceae bacterium]
MTRPETAADQRLYLADGLQPLRCRACGARVLVKKHSLRHTSIQWLSSPATDCPEFAAAGVPSALVAGCGKLRESIEAAVRDGTLVLSPGPPETTVPPEPASPAEVADG